MASQWIIFLKSSRINFNWFQFIVKGSKRRKELSLLLILLVIGCTFLSLHFKNENLSKSLHDDYAGSFQVKLLLTGLEKTNRKIVLIRGEENNVVDSSYFRRGDTIVFTGVLTGPELAILRVNDKTLGIKFMGGRTVMNPGLPFILTPGEILVVGNSTDLHLAEVINSKINDAWGRLKKISQLVEHLNWLNSKLQLAQFDSRIDTSMVRAEVLIVSREIGNANLDSLEFEYIHNYPGSVASLFLLKKHSNHLPIADLEKLFNGLTPELQGSKPGLKIQELVKKLKTISVGKPAIPFTLNGKNAEIITSQQFKGKYLLIDFWGSWCGPCRRSHPSLKILYEKYHASGLEILGVANELSKNDSINRATWLNAIEKDQLPWLQVLNNENKNQIKLVEEYGVTLYPTKILINRNDEIMERIEGDDPDELSISLKKIFGF